MNRITITLDAEDLALLKEFAEVQQEHNRKLAGLLAVNIADNLYQHLLTAREDQPVR